MLFLGCMFDKKEEKQLLNNSMNGLFNSVNTLQYRLIDGLILNDEKVKIVNVLPVGTFPRKYKKLFLHDKKWFYNNNHCYEIGSINLPVLKQYIRYRKIKKVIRSLGEYQILVYSTYKPFLKALYKLSKNYKITLIVPDLPEFYDYAKTNFVKKIIRKIYNYSINKYLSRVDKYVLLTEQMKDKLKIGDKPYVVVEGICDVSEIMIKKNIKNNNKKIIFYSGSLSEKFGILNLVNAFELICKENDNYELWICGSGDSKEIILEHAKNNNKIKFYGYIQKSEVMNLQLRATLLVNPRMNNGEYTKYSFPSKTMEYLMSGIPTLMYRLDGIPKEYDKYLYYVNGNKISDLKDDIIKICNKSNSELNAFGDKARTWILKEKNSSVQSKKIIELMSD